MPVHADRRTFLLTSSTAVAATFTSSSLFGGPNDKVSVGLIGCGGRGTADADNAQDNNNNVAITYCCDPDDERRQRVTTHFGVSESHSVRDMRVLLDDPALDAVIIGTPDHWHSPAAILACEAGKHVYVEKPISHNIREGRLLVEAAERNKVHVQHGTQSRSTAMMIDAVRALRDGIIGDVLVAKCWNIQRRTLPTGKNTDPPEGFDYDTWVGPATMIPYRTNRVHDRWTWWYHFGTGDMGNDGVHDIDYCRWGLGVDTHPNKVHGPGGKFGVDDEKEFPDTQQVTFQYNGDGTVGSQRLFIYEQRLWSRNYPYNVDSGAEFYGKSGQMFLSRRGKIQVIGDDNKPIKLDIKPEPQDQVAHMQNFLAAIRDDAKLNAPPLIGHVSTSLCHLGNISTRLGRALDFDPETETFIGDDEANQLVGREYRDHWGRPQRA